MSSKVIIFAALAAVSGFSTVKVVKAEGRPQSSKFISGCGGVYKEGELLVRFAPREN
jgi:hypothetical protein